MGIIFVVMNCVHTVLLILPHCAVRGYNEFYNQIWEASYREKTKNFNPFAVSVMKDKEIVHILIAPSSYVKL